MDHAGFYILQIWLYVAWEFAPVIYFDAQVIQEKARKAWVTLK
ncbi:hypothetical protein [Paenibacillus chibensis]|nr:hypothetical protein [Paenibacillus chibensis]MEC0370069.1 hypothetical protein [Paenibacillus chibensis]